MTKQEFEARLLEFGIPFLQRDGEAEGSKLVDHYGAIFPLWGTVDPVLLSLFYRKEGERLYNAMLVKFGWRGHEKFSIDVFSYDCVLEWLEACLK